MASLYDLSPKTLFTVPTSDRITKCKLCHLPAIPYEDRPDINLGPLYEYANPVDASGREELEIYCAHYFCLLFSPGLETKGEDDEGMRGFLPADIIREWRRGARLRCSYCDKKYATIGCCKGKNCRVTYHLPCGLLNGCHFEFREGFLSFCKDHRLSQAIFSQLTPELLFKERECGICLDTLPKISDQNEEERRSNIHSPCCGGWFHKTCAQQAAETSGYFFKCPLCNNKQDFEEEMKKFGVYVPEQDAAWELEEGMFDELLERHGTCNADLCICPEGRKKDEDYTVWEIILCKLCGSQGIHVQCGDLEFRDDVTWKCPGCIQVVKRLPPTITHRFKPLKRKKTSQKKQLTSAIKDTEIRIMGNSVTFLMPKNSFSGTFPQTKPLLVPKPVKLYQDSTLSQETTDSYTSTTQQLSNQLPLIVMDKASSDEITKEQTNQCTKSPKKAPSKYPLPEIVAKSPFKRSPLKSQTNLKPMSIGGHCLPENKKRKYEETDYLKKVKSKKQKLNNGSSERFIVKLFGKKSSDKGSLKKLVKQNSSTIQQITCDFESGRGFETGVKTMLKMNMSEEKEVKTPDKLSKYGITTLLQVNDTEDDKIDRDLDTTNVGVTTLLNTVEGQVSNSTPALKPLPSQQTPMDGKGIAKKPSKKKSLEKHDAAQRTILQYFWAK